MWFRGLSGTQWGSERDNLMDRQLPKVLITRPIQREAIDRVAQKFAVQIYPVDQAMPAHLSADAMPNANEVMPSGVRISEDLIASSPKLKVAAKHWFEYDNIDGEGCNQRHIIVTNTPDVLPEATADLAFALIISAARRIPEGADTSAVSSGRTGNGILCWVPRCTGRPWDSTVSGASRRCWHVLALLARPSPGFPMRILYYARHRVRESIEKEFSGEFVDRETLFRECDFFSVHVPLTAETRYAIPAPELAKMKPSAFFINTAPGNIVEEAALVEALQVWMFLSMSLRCIQLCWE
jgi:glyoxylate reductase